MRLVGPPLHPRYERSVASTKCRLAVFVAHAITGATLLLSRAITGARRLTPRLSFGPGGLQRPLGRGPLPAAGGWAPRRRSRPRHRRRRDRCRPRSPARQSQLSSPGPSFQARDPPPGSRLARRTLRARPGSRPPARWPPTALSRGPPSRPARSRLVARSVSPGPAPDRRSPWRPPGLGGPGPLNARYPCSPNLTVHRREGNQGSLGQPGDARPRLCLSYAPDLTPQAVQLGPTGQRTVLVSARTPPREKDGWVPGLVSDAGDVPLDLVELFEHHFPRRRLRPS